MTSGAQRIGLLPGSFNPPHLGHVDLARRAIRAADLDVCMFYVNSFNIAKRGGFVPRRDRCRLLTWLLVGPKMSVLDPGFFSDNPGEAFLPQETVFLALIDKLRAAISRNAEIWLVRGSDNFYPPGEKGYRYPPELCALPHVIGLRDERHDASNYDVLREKKLVRTRSMSSSEVRAGIRRRRSVGHLLGRSAERYIMARQLFRARAVE